MSQLNLTISVKQPVNASLDLSDVKKARSVSGYFGILVVSTVGCGNEMMIIIITRNTFYRTRSLSNVTFSFLIT